MCGRYYRRSDKQRIAEAFHLGKLPDGFVLPPDYNVAPSTFGLAFKLPVDDSIFAQPLYVPNVAIPNQGTHNVVYVATMSDTLYAFDADAGGAPLWSVNFASLVGATPVWIANFTF